MIFVVLAIGRTTSASFPNNTRRCPHPSAPPIWHKVLPVHPRTPASHSVQQHRSPFHPSASVPLFPRFRSESFRQSPYSLPTFYSLIPDSVYGMPCPCRPINITSNTTDTIFMRPSFHISPLRVYSVKKIYARKNKKNHSHRLSAA